MAGHPGAGRATIEDVAARSGLSTATVSRVLSGSVPARAATRERVLAAARELNYRPSGVARALKRHQTRTLGLLITDIANPFFPQVVRSIEAAAHERGYGIVLCNGGDDPTRELAHLELLLERRVDGIVVASSRATRRMVDVLRRSSAPVVLINSDVAGSGLPSIDAGHRRGARAAAEHLLALGHRRLAHVTAPSWNAAAAQRLSGVRDALRHAGLDPDDLIVAEGDGHVDGGARACEQLIAEGAATGIVAYNDLTAIGAMRALRHAGLRVPDDVSVVGFDDIEMAAWTDPPLTTIRQPTEAMGRWAVEQLLSGTTEAASVHLEPELVVRASTGPPGGARHD